VAAASGRRADAGVVVTADAVAVAAELADRIERLPEPDVAAVRAIRREYSARLRAAPVDDVVAIAGAILGRHRWVAYELVYHHRGAVASLGRAEVEGLGRGLDGWGAVDAFARYVAGPAWRLGSLEDADVQRWAASPDRWWRRAALVSTVPLNLRAAGGTGDAPRTLAVCRVLVADRDDMVEKALSWALRELVRWDPGAVRGFLVEHDAVLGARVKREVRSKLERGRKHAVPG
jgi:3-methyladenine DNA glycosylase AlkD